LHTGNNTILWVIKQSFDYAQDKYAKIRALHSDYISNNFDRISGTGNSAVAQIEGADYRPHNRKAEARGGTKKIGRSAGICSNSVLFGKGRKRRTAYVKTR
jgi:hypothetical protein